MLLDTHLTYGEEGKGKGRQRREGKLVRRVYSDKFNGY